MRKKILELYQEHCAVKRSHNFAVIDMLKYAGDPEIHTYLTQIYGDDLPTVIDFVKQEEPIIGTEDIKSPNFGSIDIMFIT